MALDTLVTTAPAATDGVPTQLVSGAGLWRFAVQIADPSATTHVWHDVSCYHAGYQLEHGSGEFGGRWTASVAEVELVVDDDRLAPWNDDTSAEFGIHVDLGAGLLMRAVVFRVDGGTVQEWHPRFTHRVEVWGDGTQASGRLRRHPITTRDLMTSLVNAPVPGFSLFSSWTSRVGQFLSWAEWPFGVSYYGATDIAVFRVDPTSASLSAVTLIDAVTDPAGIVWGTNRYGQLVFRPMLGDQFHADALTGGADGTAYPTETPVEFSYDACNGTELAYALTQTPQPFGIDDTELNVVNQVRVTDLRDPEVPYYVDNPVSSTRYGAHPLNFSWLVPNDAVADQIVEFRAFASKQARPLVTTVDLDNFWPLALDLEWMTPVDIEHLTASGRDTYTASGWVRSLVERVRPRLADASIGWDITAVVDIDGGSGSSSASLLPVTGLAASNITENDVDFSWTNPGGQPVTPTEVQVRLSTSVVWTDLTYPAVAYEWHGLLPGVEYEFSVRLVRRVGDQIVAVSPIRRVEFTTDTPTVPVVTPPTDPPGPDDPPVIVTPPPYDPDCDLDWKLERSTDGTSWTQIDSGTITGGVSTISLDGASFEPGYVYQLCTREDCGTPGPWYCTDVFVPECVTDAEFLTPTSFPFGDPSLVAYWPELCPPDIVRNAVSGYMANHGPAWGGIEVPTAGSIALATSVGGTIVDGDDPAVLFYGDATVSARVSIGTGAAQTLVSIPGLQLQAVASGSGWAAQLSATTFQSGSGATVTSGELALDTEYTLIGRYDSTTGEITLTVDGSTVGTDSAENSGDRAHTSGFYLGAPADSWIGDVGVWNTLVTLPTPPNPADWEYLWDVNGAGFAGLGLSPDDPVDHWPSEVGTAYLSGPSSGVRPLYRTTGDLAPCVDFDGTDDFLGAFQSTDYGAYRQTPSGVYSFIIIAQMATTTEQIVGTATGGSLGLATSAGSWNWSIGNESGSVGTPAPDTAPHVFAMVARGTGTNSLYIDGVEVDTATAGTEASSVLIARQSTTYGEIRMALVGWVDGDVTATGWWTDFLSWAATNYGTGA